MISILTIALLIFLFIMLVRAELFAKGLYNQLKEADDDIKFLNRTLSESREQADEAQMIADHAIEVINEAKHITARTIYESRIRELEKAFLDRRQREAEARELEKQIDEITGGI